MAEDLTQTEAAKRLGISRTKLRQLSNAGDVPRSKDGSYPWPAVRHAFEGTQANEPESGQEKLPQEETAKRLGITTRQLRKHDEAPRDPNDGLYLWPQIRDWYLDFKHREKLKRQGLDDSNASETFAQARARKTQAEAHLKELELQVKRKEVIPREDVIPLVQAPLEAVDRRLRESPRSLAKGWAKRLKVSEAVALELIEELVEDVRMELRGAFAPPIPGDPIRAVEPEPDPTPPKKPKPKPKPKKKKKKPKKKAAK